MGIKVRRIDTFTLLHDPYVRNMKPNRWLEFLSSGILDLEPIPETLIAKATEEKQRQQAQEQKQPV